jgi:two-component system response regulator FixJ
MPDTRCAYAGQDGLELRRRLLRSDRDIPTVFITAHGDTTARSQALEDGAVDYLFKPFSEQALLNAINGALRWKCQGHKIEQADL